MQNCIAASRIDIVDSETFRTEAGVRQLCINSTLPISKRSGYEIVDCPGRLERRPIIWRMTDKTNFSYANHTTLLAKLKRG